MILLKFPQLIIMQPTNIMTPLNLLEVNEELLISELPTYEDSPFNGQDVTTSLKEVITHYQNKIWPLNTSCLDSQIKYKFEVKRPIPPSGSNSIFIDSSKTGPLVIHVPGYKVFKTNQIQKIDEPIEILENGKSRSLLYSDLEHVVRQKQSGKAASAIACVHMIQMDMDKELEQSYSLYSRQPYGFQQIKNSLLESDINCNKLRIDSETFLRIALKKVGSLIVKGLFKNNESYFIIDAIDNTADSVRIRDPYHGWRAHIDLSACLKAIEEIDGRITAICINTDHFKFDRYI